MEICPICGELVSELDEFTGWCKECSPKPSVLTAQQFQHYLAVNADKLEYYISTGQAKNLHQAIGLIANPKNGHRPSCIVCGDILKYAPRTSVFCRKRPECRRYSRRYVYLYTKKGMSKTEALAVILGQLQ